MAVESGSSDWLTIRSDISVMNGRWYVKNPENANTFKCFTSERVDMEICVTKNPSWAGTKLNRLIQYLKCLSKMVSEGFTVEVLPYLQGDSSPGEGVLLILILPCYSLSPLTVLMYTPNTETTWFPWIVLNFQSGNSFHLNCC